MKRLLLLMLCALMIIPLKSQDASSSALPDSPKVIGRICLVTPKIILEAAPVENFTLTTGVWIRTSIYRYNSQRDLIYDPGVSPSITLEPRYYFNLEERAAKGKRTDYYSGWYVGLPFNFEFPDFSFIMGGNIGFQCTLGRRWYWNISFGPGLAYYDSRFHPTGAGDFGLGIILN